MIVDEPLFKECDLLASDDRERCITGLAVKGRLSACICIAKAEMDRGQLTERRIGLVEEAADT